MSDISVVLDQIEEAQRRVFDPLDLPPNASSLQFHQAVYRNPALPISTRQRSAMAALPFEYPKLAVTAIVQPGEFARRLDEAIQRASRAKLINGEAKAIEEPT